MPEFTFDQPHPYTLRFPADDYIGESILRHEKPYEHYALRAIAHLIPQGGTILDVGANIGNHTVFWAAGGGRVVAYEPSPEALPWLRKNVTANGLDDRVTIRPVAAGQAAGRARVASRPEGNLGGTRIDRDPDDDLEIVALDGENLARVDAIKIDVEGHEEAVIRGARELLNAHRPVLMIEALTGKALDELGELLRPLRYHRLPMRICRGPTFLYLPSARGMAGAITTPTVVAAVAGVGFGRVRRRLERSRWGGR